MCGGIQREGIQPEKISMESRAQNERKQLVLAFEMMVEQRFGSTGFFGDQKSCRAIKTLYCKQAGGRFNDILFLDQNVTLIPVDGEQLKNRKVLMA